MTLMCVYAYIETQRKLSQHPSALRTNLNGELSSHHVNHTGSRKSSEVNTRGNRNVRSCACYMVLYYRDITQELAVKNR